MKAAGNVLFVKVLLRDDQDNLKKISSLTETDSLSVDVGLQNT